MGVRRPEPAHAFVLATVGIGLLKLSSELIQTSPNLRGSSSVPDTQIVVGRDVHDALPVWGFQEQTGIQGTYPGSLFSETMFVDDVRILISERDQGSAEPAQTREEFRRKETVLLHVDHPVPNPVRETATRSVSP